MWPFRNECSCFDGKQRLLLDGGSELISHKFGGGRSAEKPSVWILLMKCGVHLSENIGDLHHLPGFVTICHLYFPFVCFYVCCAFVSIPHHPSRD